MRQGLNNTLQSDASSQNADAWYIIKHEHRYGPFSYLEVVRLIQDKSIESTDFVWHAGQLNWERVENVGEFQPDAMRALLATKLPEVKAVFTRRRHARAKVDAKVLVHDFKRVVQGAVAEIGVGGTGVVLANSSIQIGDLIQVHFKPSEAAPAFNAKCEVVSRRAVELSTVEFTYGLKFVAVPNTIVDRIFDFIQKQKAA